MEVVASDGTWRFEPSPAGDLSVRIGAERVSLQLILTLDGEQEELREVQTLQALHRRVGLLEMTTHRFLDAGRRRQEFGYADGTRVTIDLDAGTWVVTPELPPAEKH